MSGLAERPIPSCTRQQKKPALAREHHGSHSAFAPTPLIRSIQARSAAPQQHNPGRFVRINDNDSKSTFSWVPKVESGLYLKGHKSAPTGHAQNGFTLAKAV
jgi:hypothetical protein